MMENVESLTFDESDYVNDEMAITATWDSDYVVNVSKNFEEIVSEYTDNCNKTIRETDLRIGAAIHCLAEIEDGEYDMVDEHNRMHILAARAYIRDAINVLIGLRDSNPQLLCNNIEQVASLYNLVKDGPEALLTTKMRSVFYSKLFMPVVLGATNNDSENGSDEE